MTSASVSLVIWNDMMRLLFFIILMSVQLQNFAQENSAIEKEKAETSSTSDEPETQKQIENDTPDTIDPTEKLSEDIPVDFPVDI